MVLWRQVMKSHYLFIRRRYGILILILILILLLERKKAGSSIPGTSLLDCLKNGYFREDVCKRIHHSHLGKEELAV